MMGMQGMASYPSTTAYPSTMAASTTPQPQYLPTAPSMIAYPAQAPAPGGQAPGIAMGDPAMALPAPLPPFGSPFQFFASSQIPQQGLPAAPQQGFPAAMAPGAWPAGPMAEGGQVP